MLFKTVHSHTDKTMINSKMLFYTRHTYVQATSANASNIQPEATFCSCSHSEYIYNAQRRLTDHHNVSHKNMKLDSQRSWKSNLDLKYKCLFTMIGIHFKSAFPLVVSLKHFQVPPLNRMFLVDQDCMHHELPASFLPPLGK